MSDCVRFGLVLTLILVVCPLAAVAQTENDDGVNRLSEIVVSAEPYAGVEAIGTVHRITAEQISRQGAKTLDEVLRLVPGITVREGAEGTPRIDIRGLRTRHVQLFINGIPVRETYDDQFDPTTIPADFIAEIKVTTGGGSVLYGQGGNGGAIDIITKKGKKGVHGAIKAEVAEGERTLGSAALGGAGDRFDGFVSVSHHQRDHFITAEKYETFEGESDERLNSDRQRTNLFGTLGYALNDKTRLSMTASLDRGENGNPPTTNYDSNDPFSKRDRYERTDNLENFMTQAVFAGDPDGPVQYRLWAYYNQRSQEDNRYDTTMTSNDPDDWTQDRRNAFRETSDTEIKGVTGQLNYRIGQAGSATLGINAEEDNWQSDGFTVTDNSGTREPFEEETNVAYKSVALEYEHTFSDKLGAVVGYGHQFMDKKQGADDSDFTYLIGIFFDLTDSTRLRANHAKKVRFPSIKQMYDGEPNNPDLDAEVTWHYEAGIEQVLPARTTVQLTGFRIEAEDFIEKDSDGVYQNYQSLLFQGIETSATFNPMDNLMFQISYAYLETRDRSDDATRRELQYRPMHTWTLKGRYAFDFGLSIYADIQHVADQYFYDSNDVMKKKLDDYTIVNLRLAQSFGTSGFQAYIGAENLFDENYEESYGLPQPGRTLYAGAEYSF